jgi:hypothetical protein
LLIGSNCRYRGDLRCLVTQGLKAAISEHHFKVKALTLNLKGVAQRPVEFGVRRFSFPLTMG